MRYTYDIWHPQWIVNGVTPIEDVELTHEEYESEVFYRVECGSVVLSTEFDSDLYYKLYEEYCNGLVKAVHKLLITDISTSTEYIFYFSVNDIEFDLDYGTAEFIPKPFDIYTGVLRDYEDEYDILEAIPTVVDSKMSITPSLVSSTPGVQDSVSYAEYLTCDGTPLIVGGTEIPVGIREEVLFPPLTNHYHWQYEESTGVYYGEVTTGLSRPNIKLVATTVGSVPSAVYESGGYLVGTYLSTDLENHDFYIIHTNPTSISHTLSRGRLLNDVIRFLLYKIDPALTFTSTLFTSSIDPIAGGTNYLNLLRLMQMSDLKRYDASNPATSGMLSLSAILEWIRYQFNAVWWIDSNKDFHIEHITTYKNTLSVSDQTSNQYLQNQKYSYNKSGIPSAESWVYTGDCSDDFSADRKIFYDSVSGIESKKVNLKTYSITDLSTDIETILNDPDSASDDGWAMINVDANDNIVEKVCKYSGVSHFNGHLSIANLQYAYQRYYRPLLSGTWLDDQRVDFESETMKREQDEWSFPLGDDEVISDYKILTNIILPSKSSYLAQVGEVISYKHNLRTNWVDVKVRYGNIY